MTTIDTAKIKDFGSMFKLDEVMFDSEFHIRTVDFLIAILKNRDIYRVVRDEYQQTKGYFNLLPLSPTDFDLLLTGKITEGQAMRKVRRYKKGETVSLVPLSIVVNTNESNYRQYSRPLVDALVLFILNLNNQGIKINEIGLMAVSIQGKKLAERLGLNCIEKTTYESRSVWMYRSKMKDLKPGLLRS